MTHAHRLPRWARSIAIVAATLLAAAVVVVSTSADAQEGEEPAAPEEETAAVEAVVVPLTPADRFTTLDWELSVDGVTQFTSLDRFGYDEVRVDITLRNIGQNALPYRLDGFATDPLYPDLAIVDAVGEVWPYGWSESLESALPQAWLRSIDPGLTASWTIGFEVPSVHAADLHLLVAAGEVVADFDLTVPAPGQAWESPDVESFDVGDTIPWDEGSEVVVAGAGNLVCGDPDEQLVTHIFALGMEVTNLTTTDVLWPATRLPTPTGVASWDDGTTGHSIFETFWGDREVLQRFNSDAVIVPPADDPYRRALIFAAPRDGRFDDVAASPDEVVLNRPDGSAVLVELDGADDIPMNALLCDLGADNGPIPYAFGPGPSFSAALDDGLLDQAAINELAEAVVIAQIYLAANDDFVGVTAEDLAALSNGITWVVGLESVGVNVIAVDVKLPETEEAPVTVVLSTLSATDTYFCAEIGPGTDSGTLSAGSLEDAIEVCLAPPPEEEEPTVEVTVQIPTGGGEPVIVGS